MQARGWKILTAALSGIVVLLIVVAVYLASVVNMGQIATLAGNEHLTAGPLSSAVRHLDIRYSGYLTIIFNATAAIAVTVSYTFAQHNFSSTYLGHSGKINLAVLPSVLTITFTAVLQNTAVTYSVYEQF